MFTALILTLAFLSVLFIYDPLKLYHRPWLYKEYLQSDMRKQAAGIINNWDFDSIILGTSILECTSSREASKNLGGKFVNISLSGSYFYERAIVLNYVLKNKPIKTVIFSLDSAGLTYVDKSNGTFPISSWDYLYDNNPFNDFKAYINDKYIKCLFSLSDKTACMGNITDTDRPNTWHQLPSQTIKYGGFENWIKAKNDPQVKATFTLILSTIDNIRKGIQITERNSEKNINNSKEYIDDNLIRFSDAYPKTDFVLILPPYSTIYFAIDAQYKTSAFKRYKASIKYLVNESNKRKNIKIYGWGNHSFVDNISNYKDLIHYEYKINSWMLGAIQRKEGLLTTINIDAYLTTFTKKSVAYDLLGLAKNINNNL
jgi:hypothetical protein